MKFNPLVSYVRTMSAHEHDQTLLEMLQWIVQAAAMTPEDINETYFSIDYGNYYNPVVLRLSNAFYPLSRVRFADINNWTQHALPRQLFSFLHESALDFTARLQEWIIPKEKENLFSDLSNTQAVHALIAQHQLQPRQVKSIWAEQGFLNERNQVLLPLAFKQMKKADFHQRVQQEETLHWAVRQGDRAVIGMLLHNFGIDVNIRNSKQETALMYCQNLEMLQHFSQYDVAWHAQSIEAQDCLHYFASIEDAKQSASMISHAQQKQFAQLAAEGVSADYVEKKHKQTLIQVMKQKKTKKEVVQFIKHNALVDFSDTFDSDGSNLAQLALTFPSVALYQYFKDFYPPEHVNSAGMGTLEMIFQKDDRLSGAHNILQDLLAKEVPAKAPGFGRNMLEYFLEQSHNIRVPELVIYEQGYSVLSMEKLCKLFATFIGQEQAQYLAEQLHGQNSINRSLSYVAEGNQWQKLKACSFFYLLCMQRHNDKHNVFSKLSPQAGLCDETAQYASHKYAYNSLNNVFAIRKSIDEHSSLHSLVDEGFVSFVDRFDGFLVDYIMDDYAQHMQANQPKEENLKQFYHKHGKVIDKLAQCSSKVLASRMTQDFIDNCPMPSQQLLSYLYLSVNIKSSPSLGRRAKL